LGLAPEDVLETATFYHFFDTSPSGRNRVYLSNTVVAKLRGYQQVHNALERETGIQFGGPASADFGLFETACIGLSDHEPAMLIGGGVVTELTPTSVADIISRLKQGQSPAEIANPLGLSRTEAAYVDALTHTAVYRSGPVFFGDAIDHHALLE